MLARRGRRLRGRVHGLEVLTRAQLREIMESEAAVRSLLETASGREANSVRLPGDMRDRSPVRRSNKADGADSKGDEAVDFW